MIFIFSCIFTLIGSTHASIETYEVSQSKKFSYSVDEVCASKNLENLPLIEADIREVDCMGRKIKFTEFCQGIKHEVKNLGLIRGYYSNEERKVHCQYGSFVTVKYKCDSHSQQRFCQNPQMGCDSIKNRLANQLNLHKSALLVDDKENLGIKYLHCYFSYSSDELNKLNNSLL